MEENMNHKQDYDASNAADLQSGSESASEKNNHTTKYIAKNPVGYAIMDFGKSLRRQAIFLFIIDLIGCIIWGVIIPVYSSIHYDRFGADLYNTVSRGLSINAANTDGALYFLGGLLFNITLFALTIGKGVHKIGLALMGEEIIVKKTIVDSMHSIFFTRVEEKRKPVYLKGVCSQCNTTHTITTCEKCGVEGRFTIVKQMGVGNMNFTSYKCTKCGNRVSDYKCKNDGNSIDKFDYA